MSALRALQRRVAELERLVPRLRIGTVTGTDPLDVELGASGVSYEDVRSISPVTTGDLVAALVVGHDLLVLGRIQGANQPEVTDDGAATGTVTGTGTANYAVWTGGPSITIPETGRWDVWTGPVWIQNQEAAVGQGEFRVYVDGVAAGRRVIFVSRDQFDAATLEAHDTLDLDAGDVLTLRWAASNAIDFQFGTVGVSLTARRVA